MLATCGETQAAFPSQKRWVSGGPVPIPSAPGSTRCLRPAPETSGDASHLNRALRFGRNTPGPVLPVGAPPSRALSAGRLPALGARPGSTTGCQPGCDAERLEPRPQQPGVAAVGNPRHPAPGGGQELPASPNPSEIVLERCRRQLDERPEHFSLGRLPGLFPSGGPPEFLPDRVGLPPVPGAEQLLAIPEERGLGQRGQWDRGGWKETSRKMLEEAVTGRVPFGVGSAAGPVPIGRKRKTRRFSSRAASAQRSRQITNSASASRPSR